MPQNALNQSNDYNGPVKINFVSWLKHLFIRQLLKYIYYNTVSFVEKL